MHIADLQYYATSTKTPITEFKTSVGYAYLMEAESRIKFEA